MNVTTLKYGSLQIHIESNLPIKIPLPLEQEKFPTWTLPMQVKIRLFPLQTQLPKNDKRDIPEVLNEFYSAIESMGIACLSPQRHCNAWWRDGEIICGLFPYETDNFLLKVLPSESVVEISGNENNLNRVILDILSCFASLPPLHGAAVQKNDRIIVLLGESGGGKTRILKSLIDKGYTYIADEEIFWVDNRILCCGRVIVEKGGRPNHYPSKCAEPNKTFSVSDVFLLTESLVDETPPVLLPFIARQSFWAQTLVNHRNVPPMVERLIAANNQYIELFKTAKKIRVNQNFIDGTVSDIERYISEQINA